MAIRIMFDAANKPEEPTIVLARRNGTKIGALNAKEISISDSFNDAPELSFKVYKELDGEQCPLWDEITNFKLIYCVEWNAWFEMTVELDETNEIVKTVFCTGLGYAELGQIMLYTIEINTEEDIARDDYDEPTVLFNEKNPKASLLHRIMEKAPHYTITHVDASIAGIQRTFSFDDKSLYDAFQEISEEIKCIFILNANTDGNGKLQRTIEVYDLQSYCFDCEHRGDFFDVCPECGSKNIRPGYGEDTTIFITSDELADNIGFTTDTDAVKNCFKLEGGDDLMTATIRNCNPNGTDYLWYFSDDMKKDMPDDLVEKIESYDDMYKYYQNDYVVIPGYTDSLTAYNNLVDKYKVWNEDLERIEAPVKGYAALMNAYYNTIDLNLYLTSSMMPSVETIETDATKELAKLTTSALSPVAVQNVSVISNATADNVVLSMAKLIVDSRFKVKVNSSSIVTSDSSCTWTGSFVVTNYFDDEDTATGNNIVVLINDDFEEFVKEKVEKQLSKEGDGEVDIVGLFKMTYDNFVNELRKYSLNRLRSFYASCQACLDVLIEQGVADRESWDGEDPNLYDDLYYPYLQKQNAVSAEISIREQEISLIVGERDADGDLTTYGLQNYLDIYRDEIQENLDFESYLGEELWLEFCAFRREDKYTNDNYISDALNNRELFDKAQEFLERATEEIHKSAEQQHSISSELKNLLVIDKFKPLVDKFSVGNWLRIMVDDTLYKLRLINYEIDYDNIEDISVEFSDVIRSKDSASDIQSVLDQASDMATSYDSVKRQAEQGKNGNDKLNGWVNEGLSLTNMTIVGDADNQNMQWDSHGMLLREYLPITNTYDDRQLKIINRGLYVTDDNWTTSRAGIGNFRFYNPKTKEYEDAYGVIADTIVGNIVLSEEVGIYNKNNSITMDGDGFHITTSADALENSDVFVIQKENKQPDGSTTLDKLLYFDNNGNLTINGSVRVYSSGSSTPSTDTTLGDVINATTDAIDKVDVEYALGDNPNVAPSTGWSTNSPIWTEGKYIWQRTVTTTASGKTSYSKPVCIQGAAGADGLPGAAADPVYFHVAYANSEDGQTDFSTTDATNRKYMGTYVDNTQLDSQEPTKYTWVLIKGQDGADGTPGKNGEDGKTYYLHIAYANNETGTEGFSTTDGTDKKYIGQCVDTNQADPETPSSYTWSLIKGEDGLPGRDGTDGTSSYVHIKYSSVPNPTDDQMSETPDTYIGICTDDSPQDPTTASSYTWSKFEGKDGTNGLPGTDGKDGTSSYVHFAYATSPDGSENFSTTHFDGATYLGVLTDDTQSDSEEYTDYAWSLIKGADGLPGADGQDGVSSYVHIKYSPVESPNDSQMTETPDRYIGICVDHNVADPTTASSYTWSKFEGQDGATGTPGKDGEDGTSTFVHFAYSTSADGSQNFSTTPFDGAMYIGVRTDNDQNDSTEYQDYAWSLMQGKGVDDIEEQYYLSTSDTTQTGGSWTNQMPTWEEGKYIWTRSKITWSDDTITYTDPVLAQAINDANEGVHEVKSYFVYDNNGLTIGAEGDPTSVRMASSGEFQVRENNEVLARFNSGGSEILYNGNVVASYGSTTTIGSSSGYNTYINSSGIQLRSGTTALANLSSTEIVLGRTNSSNVRMASSGAFQVRSGSTVLAEMTSTQITVGRSNAGGSVKMLNDGNVQIYQDGDIRMQVGDDIRFFDSNGTASFVIQADKTYTSDGMPGVVSEDVTLYVSSSNYAGLRIAYGEEAYFDVSNNGLYASSTIKSMNINGCRGNETYQIKPSSQTGSFSVSLGGLSELSYIVLYYRATWLSGPDYCSTKIPLTAWGSANAQLSVSLNGSDGIGVITETVELSFSSGRLTVSRGAPLRAWIYGEHQVGFNSNPGTQFYITAITFCA